MDFFKFAYLDEVQHRHKSEHQFAEMIVLGFLGFLIPFAIGHPQLIVGVAVNALLIKAAFSLQSHRTLPVVFTPTLGAIARGILFGPFTIILALMAPFIWIGNFILMYAFKVKIRHNLNYALTLILGSAAKALFLYSTAFTLYQAGMIPDAFLNAMGVMQFTTAIAGGVVAYPWIKR